jgi:hypothetical protein
MNTENEHKAKFFTPHFLQAIDSVGGLGRLVDTAVMESMLNGKTLQHNLFEKILDYGWTREESSTNADYLTHWIEGGIFSTRLTRSRYTR